MNQREYEQQNRDTIDIVDYIKIIYNFRKPIILVMFLCMLLTAIFSIMQPPVYQASATFFPINMKDRYDSQQETFIKRQLDIEDLIISLLGSRKMSSKITENLNLKDVFDVNNDTIAEKLLRKSSKIILEPSGIIRISVETKVPELSTKVANAYVDNLEYFNSDLEIAANRQIVQIIDRATVPTDRMARGTIEKSFITGIVCFIFMSFVSFLIEFSRRVHLIKRLKEK